MSPQPLFNVNDGVTGRDGGPYLDEEEKRLAEERRARVEGREPETDLSKMDSYAGEVLVTGRQLLSTVNSTSIPSQTHTDFVGDALAKAADDENFGPLARGERPTAQEQAEETADAELPSNEPGDPNLADPFSEAHLKDRDDTNDSTEPAQTPTDDQGSLFENSGATPQKSENL